MNKRTFTEQLRVGAHEVQISIAGNRLLPSADVPSCSSSCSSSSCIWKPKR
jgi:hypothetical protein